MIRRSQQNSPVYGQRPIPVLSPQMRSFYPEQKQMSPQTISFRGLNRNRMNTLVSPQTRENSVERVSDVYQSHRGELQTLRQTVGEKNFILKQLQDHNENLNRQLHRTEEQWMLEFKKRYLVDYNNFQILEHSLREKLTQANARIAELSQPQKKTDFMQLKSIITTNNDQFMSQLETQTNQLSIQQNLTAKIEKQLDEDLSKLQNCNNEIHQYKNEISQLKAEIQQLKDLNNKASENNQLNLKSSQAEDGKTILKQKDDEIKLLRLSKQTQLSQIDTLIAQVADKNNQLQQLQKFVEQTKSSSNNDQNLQAEFDKLKALYGTSQQQYCILQNSYDLNQSELMFNIDKVQKLQKESDSQLGQIQLLNSKIQSTENQNESLNQQLNQLQKEIKESTFDSQKQKHFNDNKQEEHEHEDLKNKQLIESLNTQINDLKKDLQTQINEQRMVNVINTIQQKSSIREEIIKKKDSEIQQLSQELTDLKLKLTSQNEQQQKENAQLQHHILTELQFNDLVEQLTTLEVEAKQAQSYPKDSVQLESGFSNGIRSHKADQDLTEFNSGYIDDGVDHRQAQIQFDQISQQLEELEFVSQMQAKFSNILPRFINQDMEFESGCPDIDHRLEALKFDQISRQLEDLEFVSSMEAQFTKVYSSINQDIELESGCPDIDHRMEALKFDEIQSKLLDVEFEASLNVHK